MADRQKITTLSAQPSPGGQGDARETFSQWWAQQSDDIANLYAYEIARLGWDGALAARQPVGISAEWVLGYLTTDAPEESREAIRNAFAEYAALSGARQPVREPVDDYDSAFKDSERPPYLVDAAGHYALKSFLTVAEEFRRSAEPYIEAINEGACGGEDEVSEAFDTQLSRAKEAISRSATYAAPPAQAVELPYSLDADPAGIRARVADVITGTLMVGAQGHTPPPIGHWAEPFWQAARADAVAQAMDLGQLQRYSKSYSEGIYLDGAGDWVRFADVLALIDSQAVAP